MPLEVLYYIKDKGSTKGKALQMSKFIRSEFNYHGGYLTYGSDRKFVARFKYHGTPFTKAKYVTELIKNHTPSSYFAALAAGKPPLRILEEKNPVWYNKILDDFKATAKG